MVEPRRAHWTTTKHILKYLRGTIEYGLRYAQGDGVMLMGFTNALWDNNAVDKKKHFRVLFQLGIEGCLLVQQEAKVYCIELCRSEIHGSEHGSM
jgi:hypothetical protein